MVVVAHTRLVARRMSGWLYAADEADFLQYVKVIIYRLRRESAKPLSGGHCNGIGVPMLALAHYGGEHRQSRCRYSQASLLKRSLRIVVGTSHNGNIITSNLE
jgi:hypothetical protein